jgi:hypothetical protein
MPRDANAIRSVILRITTTPQVVKLLDRLVETGLYGKNRADAAEELLRQKVVEAIRDGMLPVPSGRRRPRSRR